MWARRLDRMPAAKPSSRPKPIALLRPATAVALRRGSNRAGLRGRSEHRPADFSFPPSSSEQRATRPVGCRCVLRTPSTRLGTPSAPTSIGGGSMRSSGQSNVVGGQRTPTPGRAILTHIAVIPNTGWATGVRDLSTPNSEPARSERQLLVVEKQPPRPEHRRVGGVLQRSSSERRSPQRVLSLRGSRPRNELPSWLSLAARTPGGSVWLAYMTLRTLGAGSDRSNIALRTPDVIPSHSASLLRTPVARSATRSRVRPRAALDCEHPYPLTPNSDRSAKPQRHPPHPRNP